MLKILISITSSLLLFLISCSHATNKNNNSIATTDTFHLSSKIKMVADSEPGDRMIIDGTIYLRDGKTPAKGAILAVWHTDSKGFYIADGGGAGEAHPRIHGRMKTGDDGKYEFESIKPAPYPSNNTPAHIHGHILAPNFPEYPIIYYFEGDNLITNQNRSELNNHRGGTSSIIKLTKDSSGIFRGHRDFILEYVKPTGETMKLQW